MGHANPAACGVDPTLDHHARIVRRVLGVPLALVTVVEPRRQVFPGASGLPEPYATLRETPLSHSFCQYVVRDGRPLVVPDARHDERVHDNLAITDLDVIAYAGWPLVTEAGRTIGALAAIDSEPRSWTEEELGLLGELARGCQAELQAAEREVRETEHLTRAIFEGIDVALSFYDPEGRLLLANDLAWRAAEAGGFRPDAAPWAGDEVRDADTGARVPHEQQLVPRALRGEEVRAQVHWVGPPGRQTALSGSSRTVRNADGSPRGTLVCAHDVTQLVRTLQLKDDFLATVSHELRTPLTSIIGYLELLEETLRTGEAEISTLPLTLGVIDRNARNLERRVGELVSTAARRRNLQLGRDDLCAMARSVADTFSARALTAGVALVVECPGPHWAECDRARVEQALENLVANALTYTEPGGVVTIGVSGSPRQVRLVVRDTGVGMTEDEVAQACEMFWRAESTHRDAVPGLGVGLAFARETAEAHHGRIDIESTPGRGTAVTMTIARHRQAGSLPRQPGPRDVAAAG